MGLSDRSNLLFSNLDLRASLDARRQAIDSEVRALDPNRLLNTSPDDLARFFVEKYHMEPPALCRDQWSVESKEETETREDYGHRFTATVQRLYVHIPFVGDRDLFMSRASTFTMSPPRGVVGAQTLTLAFTPGQQGGPEAVRALNDREIDEVERHLAWIRNDLEAYNGSLGAIADQAIRRRREQVLHQQGLVAGLGIPLRERAGAPETYVVPAVRRKALPTLPAASTAPFKPEPVLAMEHYDHILDVIQNMTTVMERSPATFARMDEESLRDHYLVQLNGHYQGTATGETFNNLGKTDILIREQDRNIFHCRVQVLERRQGLRGDDRPVARLFRLARYQDRNRRPQSKQGYDESAGGGQEDHRGPRELQADACLDPRVRVPVRDAPPGR